MLEGPLLGRLGRCEVRLAAGAGDVRLAQDLRSEVFRASLPSLAPARDEDRFDPFCDHLLLIDPALGPGPAARVIGTYRLLTQARAVKAGGFYGQAEFDVEGLVRRHPGRRFLELGRSCVLPAHRGRRTMELLWHGVWAYVLEHRLDVLFGCASLPGVEPQALAAPLSVLRARALAAPSWRARALGESRPLPCGPADEGGLFALPPLIKGYLRLGGRISPEVAIDRDFGTTDVLMVLPREAISARYVAHYGATAQRYA